MCVFRGCPASESPGYIWELPHHVSLSGRESFLALWKPSQQLTFPAAFSAKAWAHTWVWPTRDTRWYTRKEEGGKPMLAVGVATPHFPWLCWYSDANNGTIKRQGLSTSAGSPVGHGQRFLLPNPSLFLAVQVYFSSLQNISVMN